MMKLRFADHFGKTPGSCWRLLFVYALFPWLHPYRTNARPQLLLNRRGSVFDSFSHSKDWSFGHAFDPKKSVFSDTSENDVLGDDTTSASKPQNEKNADRELQGLRNYSSVPEQAARVANAKQEEESSKMPGVYLTGNSSREETTTASPTLTSITSGASKFNSQIQKREEKQQSAYFI